MNILIYLISCGLNIHASNNTPYIAAASKGHLNMVKYLVENVGDVNMPYDKAHSYMLLKMDISMWRIIY